MRASLQGRCQRLVDRHRAELHAELMAHDPHVTSRWHRDGRALRLLPCVRWHTRTVDSVVRSVCGLAEDSHMRHGHRRAEITRGMLGQTVQVPLGAPPTERPCRRHPFARCTVAFTRPSLRAFHGAHFRRTRKPSRGPVGPAAATFTEQIRVTPHHRRRQVRAGQRAGRGPVRRAPIPPGPPAHPSRPSRPKLQG